MLFCKKKPNLIFFSVKPVRIFELACTGIEFSFSVPHELVMSLPFHSFYSLSCVQNFYRFLLVKFSVATTHTGAVVSSATGAVCKRDPKLRALRELTPDLQGIIPTNTV